MAYIKDLLGIRYLCKTQLELIFSAAAKAKQSLALPGGKQGNSLNGCAAVLLFYENSTRTRVSFELAAKYTGAHAISVDSSASSHAKGESLADTGKTLERLHADVVIIRHSRSGAPHLLAKNVGASVINAGDGTNEHPTQALLDAFTLLERFGSLNGLKVAIVGDIANSRVARSNILALSMMGAKVWVYGPPTLLPQGIEQLGASVAQSAEQALSGANAVMALRIQRERQSCGYIPGLAEYAGRFGVNQYKMQLAAKDAVLMHPGPVNRDVELSAQICDSDCSVIGTQVTNGLCVRMGLLHLLVNKLL